VYDRAEDNDKFDTFQSGFRKGYSAVDNIFCLQAMVQKYTSKQGGRLYCLYVDFTKAFDKINHRVLFCALEKKGIHGTFIESFKVHVWLVNVMCEIFGRFY